MSRSEGMAIVDGRLSASPLDLPLPVQYFDDHHHPLSGGYFGMIPAKMVTVQAWLAACVLKILWTL